ncbi:Tetratricopeptide-like helical [Penicillium taxi]|uniref:Tetratricopeptide-like helical n=1 Tax=Penicillium taxi TaxID=168475 RepID=UPI00254565C8|nr:Tetratricopeptide-like helical [Penicillium taxi]KAJ5899483.1 Tetratricopeptide-like helical [Penicillium taxi]
MASFREKNLNAGSKSAFRKSTPEEAPKTKSVAEIWSEAMEQIKKDYNLSSKDFEKWDGKLGQGETGTEKAQALFANSRHPRDKKDKVMKTVGNCLEWVQDGLGFVKNNISGSAAQNVSEDFDLIESTFETLDNALKDIRDLRKFKSDSITFLERLTAIFIAMPELNFAERWFKSLLRGRDPNIQGACANVEKAIQAFRDIVPLQTLGQIQTISAAMQDMPDRFVEQLQTKLKYSELQSLWGRSQNSLDLIKEHFKKNNLFNSDVEARIEDQLKLVDKQFVGGTFSWIEDDSTYKAWESGLKAPYLFVLGSAGSGKTFFACHCYKSIQKYSLMTIENSKDNFERRTAPFVTYFPFKIGREESQELGNVLAYTILQVAKQNKKLSDSIAKDLQAFEKGNDVNPETRNRFLWQNLLVTKFEKITEAPRELLIILDGIEVMKEPECKMMLDLFQELSPEKCGVRVLMTGTESALISKKGFGLSGCPKITLGEKIKKENDIRKIMDFRIRNSERLRSYDERVWDKVEQKLVNSPNPISTVNITMTVMEQADDENHGMEMIKELTKPNGLYEAMIRSVLNKKSDKEREFFRFIFALCTFTQQSLSIYVLREFAKQEPMFRNSGLDVADQIEKCLSNFLNVTKTSDDKSAPELGQGEDKKDDKVAISKRQLVTFQQPSFVEYLETNRNDLIPEPLKSKVSFFVKLTNLLCGKDAESAELREIFQGYAAQWFMKHLKDIDVKKADPTDGRQVVEALTRVFHNDGEVSRIFEDLFSNSDGYTYEYGDDVYKISTEPGSSGFENLKVLREWANKMNFHDEEDLSSQAKKWVKCVIHEPHKILENLARGHFQRWTKTRVYEDAKVPYNFLCLALQLRHRTSDDFEEAGSMKINSLLKYAIEERFIQTPIQIARCQISAALVLHNGSCDEKDKELARNIYQKILEQKSISGPEKFYSHLGLAEHFYGGNREDVGDKRWNSVSEHANEALRAWWNEKSALGSDLNEERCIKAYFLNAYALNRRKNDEEAIKTCHRCLDEGFQYNSLISETLSLLVDIHSKNKSWYKIISLISQQKPDIQAEFLCHLFESESSDRIYLLMEAAVKSNRVDYLIRIVEGVRENSEGKDDKKLFFMTWLLANIYQIIAKVPKMAENLLTSGIPHSNQYSIIYSYVVFPNLVTIYQEYFMNACSEKAQLASVKLLENVIGTYEKNILQESNNLSMAELALAKMYLSIGNTQQVEAHVNRAFEICIIDLEDSVVSNDQGAFRALAKALAFLGFKKEAQVALSLMFSRVGGVDDDASSPLEEINPAITSLDTDDDKVNDLVENGEILGKIETTTATTDKDATKLTNTVSDQESSDHDVTPLVSEDSTPEQKAKDESTNSISETTHSPSSDFHETRRVADFDERTGDQLERQPDEGSKELKKLSLTFSQDLNFPEDSNFEESKIACDGVCEPNFDVSSFQPEGPKLMYCLDCMSTDFCKDCYMKQINFFDKGEDGFWYKCCWARHEYLQAPIDGWLGVKKGFIYTEQKNDEGKVEIRKVQFEDWLMSVKCRWKKRIKTPAVWDELRAWQRPQALF